jgi:gp178
MNKQELIGKYEYLNHDCFRRVDTSEVLKDLKQLDEPQKVVVPKFVADWYEKHKDDLEYDIWEYISHWGKQQKSEFYEWMNHANNKPFQTLVNMHQFGYEVEKEKRYTVKIIGITNYNSYLNYYKEENEWTIESRMEIDAIRTEHTRKELEEAGFGWVFDCEGIEIEEVE